MLSIDRIRAQFGEFVAVDDVSLEVAAGTITGLIGPNGAGKTTLFNTLTGFVKPVSGRALLEGDDITGLDPHQIFNRGILRTFQLAHEFPTLTVLENLMVVPDRQEGERITSSWFARRRVREQERLQHGNAMDVVRFLELEDVVDIPAGQLSGGQKKLLELGRTMMTGARIVFLDEIGAGVNRTLLRKIEGAILNLNREQGYTFFLIEHDMGFVARMCDPVICMAEGRVLAQGTMDEITHDEDVIHAYLGARSARTALDTR